MKSSAQRVSGFGANPFATMTQLANQLGAVNLGQGFPDFAPDAFVIQAAQEAFAGAFHQYGPTKGWPRLQHALSVSLGPSLGFSPDPDSEITITHGATEAMHAATQALLEPGDEAIMLEPMYDMYAPQVGFTGATPKYVALERHRGKWVLDPGRLRAACSKHTKVLILNTPHNPTGKVFTHQELEGIAKMAEEFDFYVLSDEAYDRLTFNTPHIPIASLPNMRDRTVTIGSAGKTFNVTGWRIGWCVASPQLSAAIRRGHQWVPFCASTPMQEATASCFERAESLGYFQRLAHNMAIRRDQLMVGLQNAGLEPDRPDGGYFVTVDTQPFAANTDEAAERFVREFGVAGIPLSVFYADGRKQLAPNCLRFAFCKSEATLEAANQKFAAIRSSNQDFQ